MKLTPLYKYVLGFFVMALLGFAGYSCKQKLFKKVDYSGTAYDNTSGLPLQNVKVVLKACGGGSGDKAQYGCQGNLFVVGSAVTDDNGNFHIREKAARSDIYYVYINYDNQEYKASGDGASATQLNSEHSVIHLYH